MIYPIKMQGEEEEEVPEEEQKEVPKEEEGEKEEETPEV